MRSLSAPWIFVALLAACSPGRTGGPDDPGGGANPDAGTGGDACTAGQSRCNGANLQICQGGTYTTQTACAASTVCDVGLGCVQCKPNNSPLCVGDNVYTCNADGSLGAMTQMCPAGQCRSGACTNDCGNGSTTLIYVVDEQYNLLSFDPSGDKNTFKRIGSLNCPASASWPAWGGIGPATPFSMSVDRTGHAWVLYTSGEIFLVSTVDASCQKTAFAPGQLGFQLFGMGYVSDMAGSPSETLFISGGAADQAGLGNLGRVDPKTLAVTTVGALPQTQVGPELTGTGNGELYGYYPGTASSMVAKMDKTTGQSAQAWPLSGLGNQVKAWAFAHWGGRFYIFVTTDDGLGNTNSQVQLFDPAKKTAKVILNNIPYIIVGAGVSTCAPVIIG